MLTQIDVECDNPFYMSVLGANPRDSLILQKVTGLGPPDKTLFVGDYAKDGGVYTGRRTLTRNPVMNVQINPNFGNGETVDGWRDILYRAFNDPYVDGDDVTIVLKDDIKADRFLTGYCEKFETEPFDSDTSVQISLICPDPYIRDVADTIVAPPSGSAGWQQVPFTYAGTAETGFEVDIKVSAATPTVTLDNNGKTMVLTMSGGFQNGDLIHINTKPGERSITYTRGGITYDVLYTLSSASPWLTLHSQSNTLKIYGATTADIVAAITNLTYKQAWWGV